MNRNDAVAKLRRLKKSLAEDGFVGCSHLVIYDIPPDDTDEYFPVPSEDQECDCCSKMFGAKERVLQFGIGDSGHLVCADRVWCRRNRDKDEVRLSRDVLEICTLPPEESE